MRDSFSKRSFVYYVNYHLALRPAILRLSASYSTAFLLRDIVLTQCVNRRGIIACVWIAFARTASIFAHMKCLKLWALNIVARGWTKQKSNPRPLGKKANGKTTELQPLVLVSVTSI